MSKWLILQSLQHDRSGAETLRRDVRPGSRPRSPAGPADLPCEWLFSVATEPVILIDAVTRRIVRANPAAAEMMSMSSERLIGQPFTEAVDASSRGAVALAMDMTISQERAREIFCRSAAGAVELNATASLFRTETGSFVLVRLAIPIPHGEVLTVPRSLVFDAVDGASVGFLLTDAGFRVEYANQAFLDLAEVSMPAQVEGRSLLHWLELSAADLATLRDQMTERRATSMRLVRLRTSRDTALGVELCAVAVPDGQHLCWGFTVRRLPSLN